MSKKKIIRYIEKCFHDYFLPCDSFFEYPLDEYPEDALVRLSAKFLGVREEDIRNEDNVRVYHRLKEYPYFFALGHFYHEYRKSFHDSRYDILRLGEVLFEEPMIPPFPTRYNYEDVKRRMYSLLREIDMSIPGTYHENSAVTDLVISTDNFFHYDGICDLVDMYLDMIKKLQELFFKAWQAELSDEEIREYDFLVSSIGIQDKLFPKGYLFYDLLRAYIPIYKSEGHTDFFSIVKIDRARVLYPWKCAEFSQDKDLVQRFVDIYPEAKWEMRKFSMTVSKFCCNFMWSDTQPCISSQQETDSLNYATDQLFDEQVAIDACERETTVVYVPKTEEELRGDGKFAEALRILSGPVSKGGVRIPVSAHGPIKMDSKTCEGMIARANAKHLMEAGDLHA